LAIVSIVGNPAYLVDCWVQPLLRDAAPAASSATSTPADAISIVREIRRKAGSLAAQPGVREARKHR